MTVRAVLFDVGGPINTEVQHERAVDARIVAAFAAEGVAVEPDELKAASDRAVASYAWDVHPVIIWHLARGERALALRVEAAFRGAATVPPLEVREGIADVLAWAAGRGLLLGLAANQPHETLARLDAAGIGHWFTHREVSGTHGFRKPDVRLFLRCCEDLGVAPGECVMVGDRIDNDIAPAASLGMRTVLFRAGRHAAQQPRCADEVPDAEVSDCAGLRLALETLTEATVAPR